MCLFILFYVWLSLEFPAAETNIVDLLKMWEVSDYAGGVWGESRNECVNMIIWWVVSVSQYFDAYFGDSVKPNKTAGSVCTPIGHHIPSLLLWRAHIWSVVLCPFGVGCNTNQAALLENVHKKGGPRDQLQGPQPGTATPDSPEEEGADRHSSGERDDTCNNPTWLAPTEKVILTD